MDTVTRVQFLDEVVCQALISFERYESNYSPSSYGQIVGQTEFFDLCMSTCQEKENSELKPVEPCLKNWP